MRKRGRARPRKIFPPDHLLAYDPVVFPAARAVTARSGASCRVDPLIREGIIIDSMPKQYLILVFIAAWCGIVFLLSLVSGWREFSQYYRSVAPFNGPRFRFQSVSMRLRVGYNNCLIVVVNTEGLHVSILFPFRIGHPPLFFPWVDISATEKRGFFLRGFELRFNRCPSIPFVISKRLMIKISEASGGLLGIPGGEGSYGVGRRR